MKIQPTRGIDMGIIIDTLSIFTGGIIGGIFGKKIRFQNTQLFSIAIMLISLVGLLENILKITGDKVIGEHTIVVTLALVVGGTLGGLLKMEDRLSALSQTKNMALNGFIDAVLFFGIGGLQISGPILYAMTGDSFQLILKGIIVFPFALMLGATYGKKVSLSAIVIMITQILIATAAYFLGNFISNNLLCQLCSLGYIILFFSGFNMLCPMEQKVKNINMIPGILLIIIYNIIKELLI